MMLRGCSSGLWSLLQDSPQGSSGPWLCTDFGSTAVNVFFDLLSLSCFNARPPKIKAAATPARRSVLQHSRMSYGDRNSHAGKLQAGLLINFCVTGTIRSSPLYICRQVLLLTPCPGMQW